MPHWLLQSESMFMKLGGGGEGGDGGGGGGEDGGGGLGGRGGGLGDGGGGDGEGGGGEGVGDKTGSCAQSTKPERVPNPSDDQWNVSPALIRTLFGPFVPENCTTWALDDDVAERWTVTKS